MISQVIFKVQEFILDRKKKKKDVIKILRINFNLIYSSALGKVKPENTEIHFHKFWFYSNSKNSQVSIQ